MGRENNKLASDISGLISIGEFTSQQLSMIEVACRKERARIGPHPRSGAEPEGRKHKRLRRPTPEDVSAELASRYANGRGTAMNVDDPAPTDRAQRMVELGAMDYSPGKASVSYDGKHYYTAYLRSVFTNEIFTTHQYPALSGKQCRVVKVNRTRAIVEVEGSSRNYSIPLVGIINIYLNGEFQ